MNKKNRPKRIDVARLAGVSVATVSYVVNNGPRPVAAETRARVQAAIAQLNYRPHAIARSLSRGKTLTVGFLVPSLVPAFIAHLADSVEDKLARKGYGLILATSHEDPVREKHMLDILSSRSIDGLMFVPTSCENAAQVRELIEGGLPVVFVDRYIPGIEADVVATDNVEAARHATEYLIDRGCRRLVCLSFSDVASSALDRVKGYRIALSDNGFPHEEHPVLVVKYAAGDQVSGPLLEYMRRFGVPDGILCTTDVFFTDTVKFLRSEGVRVPGRTYVTGSFFFSPWNEILDPPLPIVSQDYDGIAERAVELLVERMKGAGPNLPARVESVPAAYLHEIPAVDARNVPREGDPRERR